MNQLNTYFTTVITLLLLGISTNISAQTPQLNTDRSSIDEHLAAWLTEHDTPSAAVAIVVDGKPLWAIVEGEQSIGKHADHATLYNVASLAKPVTAELALRLSVEDHSFLSANPSKWWVDPDIENHKWLDSLRISHLLAHQSGLPNWRYQTDDSLRFLFQPGSASGYSGEGYQYLAKAIEHKWQQPFEQMMQEHVFEAARMSSTSFTQTDYFADHIAHPKGRKGAYGKPSIQTSYVAADDLYTTIDDFSKFLSFVLQGKALTQGTRWQLDFNMADKLCASGRLGQHCPDELGFVMGWSKLSYPDATFYIQGGGDWGERTFALIYPDMNQAIVVFTNGANGMHVIKRVFESILPHEGLLAFLTMQTGQ
ncbi:serine hydrolase domain-containing protein [Ningiella sp. W23]|uniref:serine hydrolase domain-containing protein n=1 Tax=Ningiella sp. W23 TaxID=3023715 RepID=UPI003756F33C